MVHSYLEDNCHITGEICQQDPDMKVSGESPEHFPCFPDIAALVIPPHFTGSPETGYQFREHLKK